jgi:large subunit ribosomal protein L24
LSTANVHVKRGDTVVVISGKDKGKKSEVLKVIPKANKVIVKGVNMATKHQKPNARVRQGGIIHQEAPLAASNVMLYCTKCNNVTRIAHQVLADGSKVRICKHCSETF